MAAINNEIAAKLWESADFTVERFHAKVQTSEQVDFLGHADVTIDARRTTPGLIFRLRGLQVKILKGNERVDMPSEKGNDNKYYPIYFPLSGELRACLTAAVFMNGDVKSAVQKAAELRAITAPAPAGVSASGATSKGANPFSG